MSAFLWLLSALYSAAMPALQSNYIANTTLKPLIKPVEEGRVCVSSQHFRVHNQIHVPVLLQGIKHVS